MKVISRLNKLNKYFLGEREEVYSSDYVWFYGFYTFIIAISIYTFLLI